VFNVPSEIFEVPLDADKLPKDGFYLKSDMLELQSRQIDNKTVQAMVARGQVFFRNTELFGVCDELTFDEATDTIIFTATPGKLVRLVKRDRANGKETTIPGEKVRYNRKTSEVNIDKAGVIKSSWRDVPAGPAPTRLIGLAGLHANRQDQAFLALGLAACDDRQELAAHGAIDDLALVRRDDRERNLVVLVGAVLNDHLGGLVIDERECPLLAGRERF
jgi:hypothetical protein